MTLDQLFADTCRHILKGKPILLFLHPGMQRHLKQNVAEFLAQEMRIVQIDGVHRFVGLFEEVLPDGFMRLHLVPRAAVLRGRAAIPTMSARSSIV